MGYTLWEIVGRNPSGAGCCGRKTFPDRSSFYVCEGLACPRCQFYLSGAALLVAPCLSCVCAAADGGQERAEARPRCHSHQRRKGKKEPGLCSGHRGLTHDGVHGLYRYTCACLSEALQYSTVLKGGGGGLILEYTSTNAHHASLFPPVGGSSSRPETEPARRWCE